MFLVFFGCKDEEPEVSPFVNTMVLVNPTDDGLITPWNSSVQWNQVEEERVIVEIFSDDSYTQDSRLFVKRTAVKTETSLDLPLDFFVPGTEYWLRLSNETSNLDTKVTFELGIEPFVGVHNVSVTEALPDGNEPAFSSTLTITKIDESTIKLIEPQSGLDLEVSYENTIAMNSIWYIRTAPDANIGLYMTDNSFEVKYYLEGLNNRPFWEYESE